MLYLLGKIYCGKEIVLFASCTVFMNSSLFSYEFHSSANFVFMIIVFLCSKIIELFVYPLSTCGSVLSVSCKRGVLCISIVFMSQVVRCDNDDIRTSWVPLFPNQKLLAPQTDDQMDSDSNINTNRWTTFSWNDSDCEILYFPTDNLSL